MPTQSSLKTAESKAAVADWLLWTCLGLFIAIKIIFGSEFDLIWSLFYFGQVAVACRLINIDKEAQIQLQAPLDICLRALDLLMSFRLQEYTFIKSLMKSHYCPMKEVLETLPTMLFAIIGAGVFSLLLLLAMVVTKCCPSVREKIVNFYEGFVWSSIFRMILQSFLILSFSMAANFKEAVAGPTSPSEKKDICEVKKKASTENDSADNSMSLLAQGLLKVAFIVVFMGLSTRLLLQLKANDELTDVYKRKRYGGLFTYLRYETNSPKKPLLWPLVFMVQRLLLSIQFTLGFIIYAEPFAWTQFTLLIYNCLGYLCFLLHVKPFHDGLLLKLEVFNQYCLLVFVYFLMTSTTDLTKSLERRFSQGEALSNLIYTIVGVNIIVCITTQVAFGIRSIKKKCDKREEEAAKATRDLEH